ncbi:hypothetical protein HK100_007890 [Physocladia obscura]|uniref:CRAL-TRIO domain-containing protein n=1 Tax=Physocladia obscura TaxID=109957 RepID=A0AAD5SNS4_9FUNG|nr:hypothetical protein HK100_007890 [Physocladia obscura]
MTSIPILTAPERFVRELPANYPFNELTETQAQALANVRKNRLAGIYAGLTGKPCDNEPAWTDDVCLLKYLRATKWDFEAAVKRLQETMQWRRDFRPTENDIDSLKPHAAIGGQYYNGFDKLGRPILVLISRLGSEVKDYDTSLRYSLYTVEKGIKMMPKGVTQLNVLCDYSGMTMFNGYPLSVTSKFLGILSRHYPELLGTLILINPSWYMPVAFTVLGPFIDPVTKAKMRFANPSGAPIEGKTENGTGGWCNILDIVDADMLAIEFGGSVPFTFNADIYWKEFLKIRL